MGPRDRMIRSASSMLRRSGVQGTSVARVVEHSGAPRGSVVHHFPGGKRQLISEAVELASGEIATRMRSVVASGASAADLVAAVCDYFAEGLTTSAFRVGCPVAAVAQESFEDEPLRAAAADALTSWRTILADVLREEKHSDEEADSLANIVVAAVEGAILMARVDRSVAPVSAVCDHLTELLRRDRAR